MRTDESYMVSHFKLYPAVFLLRCHMYTKHVGCPEKCCFGSLCKSKGVHGFDPARKSKHTIIEEETAEAESNLFLDTSKIVF